MIGALTVLVAGTLQLISWVNSIGVGDAGDTAKRAMDVTQKVTSAIGHRRYATFTFIPTMRAMLNPNEPQGPRITVIPDPDRRAGDSVHTAAVPLSPEMWAARPDHPGSFEPEPSRGGTTGQGGGMPADPALTLAGRSTPAQPAPAGAKSGSPGAPSPALSQTPDTGRSAPPVKAGGDEVKVQEAREYLQDWETELRKRRFDAYYDALKQWNESIDQLMNDTWYALDLGVVLQARGETAASRQDFRVFHDKVYGPEEAGARTEGIDCTRPLGERPLTSELKRLGLDADSLNLQLAGINVCFIYLNRVLDQAKQEKRWSPALEAQVKHRLETIREMGNELNCHALHRVDYYRRQKDDAIFGPVGLWNRLTDSRRVEALKHFDDTAASCSPGKAG